MDRFTPFYRQLLVAGTSHLAGLSVGTLGSYPIVLLHQLPADPNVSMDLDSSSWIASVHGVAGILTIFITPLMQWKGRRLAFIISTLIIIIGWSLITIANNATTIIIGESFHGLGSNSVVIISLVTISEMIDPKYRTLAMLLFGIFQALGSILVTIVGHFLHYKTVCGIMGVPNILALLLSFLWPDSPSWLAYKGDFDRCEQIFTWLRGSGEDSMKELNALISAQREISKEKAFRNKRELKINAVREFFESVTRRDFYLPMACLLLIMITFYGSGILVIFIYGMQLVESMTGITNPLIPMVLMDVTIAISCVLAIICERRFNNKQIFAIGGLSSIIFLLFSCIVTYLSSVGIVQKGSMLYLYCFLGSLIANASGLASTVFNVSTELIPVKHRGLGGAIYLIVMCSFHTISIKTGPYLFLYIDVWGAYIIYFVLAVLGYFLIWKYIPETKNRTLQEIEDNFNHGILKDITKDDSAVRVPIIE